jgi:UPF0271 protein
MTIDINCDMGEGIGNDEFIMPFISSANIACGYHASNEDIMKRTIELCIRHQVAIGAHPSFFDRENFGRTEIHLSRSAIYDLVVNQVHFLNKIAIYSGASLHHVKPHGALYNMSAKNRELAVTIAEAVKDVDENLILYGLSGSHSIPAAKQTGLKTASEVFADRTYQDDGTLTPRSKANALIEEEEKAVQQALQMVKEGTVTTVSGKKFPIVAETICIHGDGKQAVEFAKKIHDSFTKNQIQIQSLRK